MTALDELYGETLSSTSSTTAKLQFQFCNSDEIKINLTLCNKPQTTVLLQNFLLQKQT